MREYIETSLAPSPLRTRFRRVLENNGILELPVWYFLAMPVAEHFMKIRGIGKGCRRILDEALARSGGLEESLGSMTALWQFAETLGTEFRHDRGFGNVMLAVIAGSVCGYSHFSSEPKLVEVLLRHGLHPRMPVGELFVYDAHAGDPPKPSVTEELLRFGAMSARSVFPWPTYEFEERTTVIELLMEFALQPRSGGPITEKMRGVLIAEARKRLSPEALVRIGCTEG